MNARLAGVIEQKEIYMHTQSPGVIIIAETLIGDANPSLGLLLDALGGESHTLFEARPCKLRLLWQRGIKIWQVVDGAGHSLVQCTTSNSPAPALVSEVLLWLGCAGYGKESLQHARKILAGW